MLSTVCKTISEGTFALFGLTHQATVDTIQSFTRTFTIPMVTPSVPIVPVIERPQPPTTSSSHAGVSLIVGPTTLGVGQRTAALSPLQSNSKGTYIGYNGQPEIGRGLQRPTWFNSSTSSSGSSGRSGNWMLQPPPPSGLVSSSRYPYPNIYPGTSSHHRIPGAPFAVTEPGSYIIHMRPSYERAVVDVVRYYGWKQVSYVYDTNEGKKRSFHHSNRGEYSLHDSSLTSFKTFNLYLL